MVKVDTCQEIYEGFKNYPGNWEECIQKLVEKPAGFSYIICSTVIPAEFHVVLSLRIRCVAKLSGCGAFNRFRQFLYQSKNPILLVNCASAVFIPWDFRYYSFRQLFCAVKVYKWLSNPNIDVKYFYDRFKTIIHKNSTI